MKRRVVAVGMIQFEFLLSNSYFFCSYPREVSYYLCLEKGKKMLFGIAHQPLEVGIVHQHQLYSPD